MRRGDAPSLREGGGGRAGVVNGWLAPYLETTDLQGFRCGFATASIL